MQSTARDVRISAASVSSYHQRAFPASSHQPIKAHSIMAVRFSATHAIDPLSMTKLFNNTCLTAASICIAQSAAEILSAARPEILISVTPLGIIFAPIKHAKLSTTMARISTTQTYCRGITTESRDIVFAAFNAKRTLPPMHGSANTIPNRILYTTFAPCVTSLCFSIPAIPSLHSKLESPLLCKMLSAFRL
jgi:hypothetical protein